MEIGLKRTGNSHRMNHQGLGLLVQPGTARLLSQWSPVHWPKVADTLPQGLSSPVPHQQLPAPPQPLLQELFPDMATGSSTSPLPSASKDTLGTGRYLDQGDKIPCPFSQHLLTTGYFAHTLPMKPNSQPFSTRWTLRLREVKGPAQGPNPCASFLSNLTQLCPQQRRWVSSEQRRLFIQG